MKKCNIEYHWNFSGQEIVDRSVLEQIAQQTIKRVNLYFDNLAVVFVDDDYIKELHGKYLDDHSATDVMTFDLRDDEGEEAEIYISVDTAVRVAEELGIKPQQELIRYMIHGILHLAGYEDSEEEKRVIMKKEENRLVDEFKNML